MSLLTNRPDLLKPPLADIAAGDDPLEVDDVIAAILGYALARRDGDTLQLHRLVAAVIRAHIPDRDEQLAVAQNILAASIPADYKDTTLWPAFRQVTPHVLAAWEHAEAAGTDPFRKAVITANAYLRRSGQSRAAHELSSRAHGRWRGLLGDDHPDTLKSAHNLARDWHDLGKHQAARQLDDDTLARRRRVLGDNHPDTLRSAGSLAADDAALARIDN